jgi:acyl-CoA synthetase (AMP-forming)/AMP-acid ligase II
MATVAPVPKTADTIVAGENEPSWSALSSFRAMYTTEPDRRIFTFVNEAGRDQEVVTAGQLATAAERIAQSLGAWGFAPGDRALLVYPPSIDFIRALVGCLLAGVIPVPVYPPDPLRPRRDLPRFRATLTDSGARAVLTNGAYLRAKSAALVPAAMRAQGARWPQVPWHRTDRRANGPIEKAEWYEPADVDEPAFLQYTSGSTGDPRGVMITHANLRHELAANARDLGLGPDTRAVSWLPLYHDLGLINFVLSSLAGNGHSYLMSPLTFLRRPAVWFDVMSRVGATHTAAPNFAFDLAVSRVGAELRESWNLRSVEVIMSAGEPIRPSTVQAFLDAFAVTGLRAATICGAYGLAEHTVSVTVGGNTSVRLDRAALAGGRVVLASGSAGDHITEFFSCGRLTKPDAHLVIVDPQAGQPCPPNQVGEIWVDSRTRALGYYGRPAETQRTFRARIAGGGTEFLRTGDLGFVLAGELYVTGRLKDLIVVHGRNVYPQDLEDCVRDCHPAVRRGGVAAFAVDVPDRQGHTAERAVVFVEVRSERLTPAQHDEVIGTVRHALFEEHDITCHAIVLGRPGRLVRKTTSGKVRRGACRTVFLDGSARNDAIRVQFLDALSAEPSDRAFPPAREASKR